MTAKANERKNRLRWPLRAVAAIVLFVLLTLWLGPILARPILERKLQDMVSSQLDATLRIGSLRYSFPYGIEISDAGLVAQDHDGTAVELLTIPLLEIGLAKLPFGDGPLVISRLKLHNPAVKLIRTESGFVGRHIFAPPDDVPAMTQPAIAERRPKLSEIFELRLVAVTEGRIIYTDRRLAGIVPMVWQHIDINLNTDHTNNPLYDFKLSLQSGSTGSATLAGVFHIDDQDVTIRELAAKLVVAPGAERSPAPPEIQQILQRFDIRGTLELTGNARFRPMALGPSSFDATVSLSGGHLKPLIDIPALEDAALSLRVSTGQQPGQLNLSVTSASATMGPVRLAGASGRMTAGMAKLTWSVDQLDALLRLADAAEGDLQLRIDGSGGALPQLFGSLNVRIDSHRLLLLKQKLLLTELSVDAAVTPEKIELVSDGAAKRGLHASLFGGTLDMSGSLRPRSGMAFEVPIEIVGVDLQQVTQHMAAHGGPDLKMTGIAMLKTKLEGSMPNGAGSLLRELRGNGRAEISSARMYEVKSITSILGTLRLGKDAGQFRQAAGIFTIAEQKVSFSRIAASSSSLGLQGSGSIGFDGQIDLRVVAALLEDWRGNLKKTGIPLVSNIMGEVAGGVQKLINAASANLITQFHIHGPIGNPQVTTEPTPLLTEQGAKLFGKMLDGTGKLLD